ncbi:MAG: T9SS type A sorting domain-containing protein [Flavobacteriaceae bacterium]|nr:T9SS type A sorting domain-containing protein [Flavobacteriaceae bacterium]MDG1961889.1 T9SS type A sorting domain-containing protein [Flavobacteriaceae bacterium]
MNTHIAFRTSLMVIFISLMTHITHGQERIAVIQEPFVVLLDPAQGNIIDPTFIDLSALNPGTPKDLLQVGEELWITDQIEDRIDRFDLSGVYIGALSTGFDNVKGMDIVNQTEVWVTNSGSANGAPGPSIIRLDFSGNNLGFIDTNGDTAFDVLDTGTEVYISYINTATRIERRDYSGVLIDDLVPTGQVTFIQQMALHPTGDTVYAAVFSNNGGNTAGLYEFSRTNGTIVNSWAEGSLRGVMPLDDGQLLLSAGGGYGVKIFDPSTGSTTSLWSTASQYISRVNLAPCSTPATPTGQANQTFNQGALVQDIIVSPTNVVWYGSETDALSGQNPLPGATELVDGATYYAVNLVDGCPSLPLGVTISLTVLSISEHASFVLSLYPNPVKTSLNITSDQIIQTIQLHNVLGQRLELFSPQQPGAILPLAHYTQGTYFVSVTTEKGTQVISIVKQ